MLLCFCLLKLREQMLGTMTAIVRKVPTNTPAEVQVVARSLTALTQEGSELSPTAQVQCWSRNNIIGGKNKLSICHYCVTSLSTLFTEVHGFCWWVPDETIRLTFTFFVHSRQGVWGLITNVLTTKKCHLTPTKNVCFHLQEEASLLLGDLSSSLLNMEVNNSEEIQLAASTIVEGAGNILDYSSNVSV